MPSVIQLEHIYKVATHQFAVKGYLGTSMRDLGEALGLHAGSLYAHIKSKEDILFEIIDRISSLHQRDLRRIMRSSEAPLDKLREIARCHMRLLAENLEAATVYFHEWRNLDEARRHVIIAKRDEFESGLREIISDCTDLGLFRPVDTAMAAKALLGMLNWTYQWYSPEGRLPWEDVADTFVGYLVDGLWAAEPTPPTSS